MSNYNTGNPVPSIDPRDLDDNATNFDRLLLEVAASVPDRLGVPRKTWYQMEQDALALISPNVSALAGLSGAADRLAYFTGVGAMSLTTLTAAARTVLDDTTVAAMLATMGGAPLASPALTGIPAAPTAAPGTNTTQLATTAFVEAARVTLAAADALKAPLVSPALTGTPTVPTAAPGTNTTQAASTAFVEAARIILAAADALKAPLASPSLTGTPLSTTPAVGTNTTQIATAAMVQAEIANKRTWTAYTPTLTASAGTYTTASATGKYMVAFGICHLQATITVTTIGTGTFPKITLPVAALAGSANMVLPAHENVVNGKLGGLSLQPSNTEGLVIAYDGSNLVTANTAAIYINGSYPIA